MNTGLVWYCNVDLCPVVKWSSIQMVVWKLDWKGLFKLQNVQYLEWSAKSRGFTIWIPDTFVQYSDGYCTNECLELKLLMYSADTNTGHLKTGSIWIPAIIASSIQLPSPFALKMSDIWMLWQSSCDYVFEYPSGIRMAFKYWTFWQLDLCQFYVI